MIIIVHFNYIVLCCRYSEVMLGGRRGLVQYLKMTEASELRLMEIERLKARHNRTVWQRVARKQVKKIKLEDLMVNSV